MAWHRKRTLGSLLDDAARPYGDREALGASSAEMLNELGYSAEAIADLKQRGVPRTESTRAHRPPATAMVWPVI